MSAERKDRRKAVALRYDKNAGAAPKVTAKGAGSVAERIIALAREHGIPIREDSDLAEVLSFLKLNQEIPPETYTAVAEILAFIYRTNASYKR